MRILVVGSVSSNLDSGTDFEQACYQIGAELARLHCHVILGSNRYTTADHHIMKGMRSVRGTHKITLVIPLDKTKSHSNLPNQDTHVSRESPTIETEQLQPGNLKIEYLPIRGPWGVGRITQLLKADTMIAIGGNQGTKDAIRLAPELRRPVVAIPSFGGSSEEAWNELIKDYSILGSRIGDYYSLAGTWSNEKARTAVVTACRLSRRNPYEDKAWRYIMYLSLGLFALFVAWVLIFSYPCSWWNTTRAYVCSNDRPTVFLLFWIAAFLGTGLRAAKRAADDPSERISTSEIFIEGAVGLSVSFGLSLVYMAGLFLATADSNVSALLSDDKGDFRRTAVLMSAISFGSAFLLEGSLAKLQQKLRESVLEEK